MGERGWGGVTESMVWNGECPDHIRRERERHTSHERITFIALRVCSAGGQAWRRSPRGPYFLCLCKESKQRNTPQAARPTLRSGSASGPGIFVRHILCHTKTPPSMAAPFGFYPVHSPCLKGARKQRRQQQKRAGFGCVRCSFGAPEVRQSRRVKPRRGDAQGCASFPDDTGCVFRKFPPGLRTRRTAAGGPPGCAFFAYFLCTSKESKAPAASGAMPGLNQTHTERCTQ